MLKDNQVLQNEQHPTIEPVKKSSVVEIDLRKGEKRKLTFLGFKGKVALSIILMVYLTLGLLVAIVAALNNSNGYVAILLVAVLIAFIMVFLIVFCKRIRNHKKRYILKSDSLDELVDHLECPNYEEKVRMEDKKITFKSEEDDVDYYDTYEEDDDDEATSYVQAYEEIDFEQMVMDIVSYASKKGLSTDALSVRSFLSAITSSHLIEIKSRNLELSKKFVDVVSEYFFRKPFYAKENQIWQAPEDILWKKQNNVLVETEILKSVLHASKNKNNFTFLGMVDVNYSKLENYFTQFLSFVNYPNRRLLIEVSSKFNNGVDPAGKVSIPKNLWFIVFPKNIDENKAPVKIAKNLVTVEITGTIIEPTDAEAKNEAISIEQFEYSVNKKADESDFNEELWKKYDEFIHKLEEIVKLDLNDKYFYGIENYAIMFKSTGTDEGSALDNVINAKILPLVLNLKNLDVNEVDSIIDSVDNIFDTEGFTVTPKTLNRLKEN